RALVTPVDVTSRHVARRPPSSRIAKMFDLMETRNVTVRGVPALATASARPPTLVLTEETTTYDWKVICLLAQATLRCQRHRSPRGGLPRRASRPGLFSREVRT